MLEIRKRRAEDSSWASKLDATQMGSLRKQVLKSIMEYDSGNRDYDDYDDDDDDDDDCEA